MATPRLWLSALLLAPLLGCGGSGSEAAAAATDDVPAPRFSRSKSTSPQIFESILPPREVEHAGTRIVEIYDVLGVQTLAYRETVASDGMGQFALAPIPGAPTPNDPEWQLRQRLRPGVLVEQPSVDADAFALAVQMG